MLQGERHFGTKQFWVASCRIVVFVQINVLLLWFPPFRCALWYHFGQCRTIWMQAPTFLPASHSGWCWWPAIQDVGMHCLNALITTKVWVQCLWFWKKVGNSVGGFFNNLARRHASRRRHLILACDGTDADLGGWLLTTTSSLGSQCFCYFMLKLWFRNDSKRFSLYN